MQTLKFFKTMIFFSLLILHPISHAGGVHIGNGGSVIRCGVGENTTITTMEYWLANVQAESSPTVRPIFDRLRSLETPEGVHTWIATRLGTAPWFLNNMDRYRSRLKLDDPVISEEPLNDVGDDGFLIDLPEGCEKVQAVVRRNDRLYWYAEIFNHITPIQRKILEFHEVIYMYGALNFGHKSSRKTQDLLVHVFTAPDEEFTARKLNDYLRLFFNPRD